ncbi:MAG: AmmeMemoRadiSam system protein B [Planctomycetota bacterium]
MRPKLRPVEVIPAPDGEPSTLALRDPAGLSPAMLTVSLPVLFVLGHFDGEHTLEEAAAAFARQFGLPLPPDKLENIVTHLQEAYFLDDEAFEAYYQSLVAEYRSAPARTMRSAEELGIDRNIGRAFDTWMATVPDVDGDAPIAGVIAPHLDYPRGAPCYAAAYAALRHRPAPERIIILGTNHFGRSPSVVTTGKDFVTPLGTTRTDVEFIGRLEARCGDLRRFEFDHQREHSVELQVLWCQHLFGPTRFSMVPILCPDPCGPTGTKPAGGEGVDLRDFAQVLGECIGLDGKDTLLIAGADLSHVGAHFGDERELDESFLPEVRERDHRALKALGEQGPEVFLGRVAEDGNPTRICSAGCIFALTTALTGAKPQLLRYHQAVHEASQTGVTCAAVLVTR